MMVFPIRIYLLLFFFSLIILNVNGQSPNIEGLIIDNKITIVDRTGISDQESHPIAFGKRTLFSAIEKAGGLIETVHHWTQTDNKVFLLLGTLDNIVIRRLVENEPDIKTSRHEGVFYQWRVTPQGTALIVGGSDSKGLMYALNELSHKISADGLDGLKAIKNTVEHPDNPIRGIDKFIKDQNDDSWFFSEAYWQYYLQELAVNRFNRFTLITGYNDGSNEDFMIPVYPYLFKVPGFEEIQLTNNIVKSPEEYLSQLRRIGELCHYYGLEFVMGIWGHGKSEKLVHGLPEDPEAYTEYCSNGMKLLITKVPELDGIQLRVNYESGVGSFGATAENFWKAIITAVGYGSKERNGKLFLDIRAKGLTEKMRQWVLESGLNLSVTSKYTWEGVGLPYHPTEMRKGELTMLDNIDKRQRYGYADFLNNSRDFDFIYRLWGIGSIRMFTWADPDYVKRFSHTASFGGSRGFQVTPPMSRKANNWDLIQDDSLVYYTWEDQRYWSWYLLFGRLGYSIDTNPEVWQRAFRKHYGQSYSNMLDAYNAAGKILPLLTSAHLTYHPANYNWAEIESGGALFSAHNANPFYKTKDRTYQSTEPGDPGLFYIIEDYVKDVLRDDLKSKINPIQLSALFEKYSKQTLEAITQVNIKNISKPYQKEFTTNEIDLNITAALGAYHSFKIKAATNFVFFQETQNKGYLKSSLENMIDARIHWEKIVRLTEKLYHRRPFFLHDNGTWKDRLEEIEKDINKLHELIGDPITVMKLNHWDKFIKTADILNINLKAMVPEVTSGKEDIKVALITDRLLLDNQIPKVHYRAANMTLGKFNAIEMTWNGENYRANIPVAQLNPDYDLLLYFSTFSNEGHVILHPGLLHEKFFIPYYVVKINK